MPVSPDRSAEGRASQPALVVCKRWMSMLHEERYSADAMWPAGSTSWALWLLAVDEHERVSVAQDLRTYRTAVISSVALARTYASESLVSHISSLVSLFFLDV